MSIGRRSRDPSPMRSMGEVARASVTKGVAACAGSWGHPLRRLRRHLPHGCAAGEGPTANLRVEA
jgi:hypothetical protein